MNKSEIFISDKEIRQSAKDIFPIGYSKKVRDGFIVGATYVRDKLTKQYDKRK